MPFVFYVYLFIEVLKTGYLMKYLQLRESKKEKFKENCIIKSFKIHSFFFFKCYSGDEVEAEMRETYSIHERDECI